MEHFFNRSDYDRLIEIFNITDLHIVCTNKEIIFEVIMYARQEYLIPDNTSVEEDKF